MKGGLTIPESVVADYDDISLSIQGSDTSDLHFYGGNFSPNTEEDDIDYDIRGRRTPVHQNTSTGLPQDVKKRQLNPRLYEAPPTPPGIRPYPSLPPRRYSPPSTESGSRAAFPGTFVLSNSFDGSPDDGRDAEHLALQHLSSRQREARLRDKKMLSDPDHVQTRKESYAGNWGDGDRRWSSTDYNMWY